MCTIFRGALLAEKESKMTIYPDADLTNADWTKQSFDFPGMTKAEFLAHLKARGITVEEFKTMPAYQLALRSDAAPTWLGGI
jgi:hypothetical protein